MVVVVGDDAVAATGEHVALLVRCGNSKCEGGTGVAGVWNRIKISPPECIFPRQSTARCAACAMRAVQMWGGGLPAEQSACMSAVGRWAQPPNLTVRGVGSRLARRARGQLWAVRCRCSLGGCHLCASSLCY